MIELDTQPSVARLPGRTSGPVLQWLGKVCLHEWRGGRVAALADGTVVLVIGDKDNELTRFSLSHEEAGDLARHLLHSSIAAKKRGEQLSGATLWVAELVGVRLFMTHLGKRREFRATVLRRSRFHRRCESCAGRFSAGDRAYRDSAAAPRHEWFGGVLICERCATPRPQGIRGVDR